MNKRERKEEHKEKHQIYKLEKAREKNKGNKRERTMQKRGRKEK